MEAPPDLATAVDPVDPPHEPPPPEPAAPVAEPAPRSDKWWVDEEPSETTSGGGGLSILGLSSTDSGNGGRYSYLPEEEQPSRTRLWVFLVAVLVLGGVLYAKWQPIRDYVLTTAPSHSRPQPPPAQETKNERPSSSATSAPATTLAASDAASQPALTTENKPELSQAAQPSQELPHADPQSSAASKPDDSPKPTPARASSKRAAEPASKPAAQMAPAAPGNAGSELVSSGERYLYARGVARNCNQAVIYFNAAAAMQNPQAFSHLGALYATGECVPMDRAVAYAWFRRAYAREPGNRYFERNLTMLWREMTPAERQRATGRQ
ncbi:MAG: hypothetical protein LAN70_10045 [Acidobacteriia bacterium]|nr:hypothetical protein [Terriglobia bacterium]